MQITDLRLESAELDYTLPKKATEGKAMPQPITYYNLAKKIQSVVATLPEFKIPDLVLGPDKLNVKKLFIQDKATRATIGISRHNEILTFSFGTYDLKGRFQGHGKAEDLLKTATGQVAFTAKDGRIYYDAILIEVLKFLNPLELFKGRANIKDMETKGFGYHSFGVKAKLEDGKLRYDEAVLHGQPMAVTAAGEHDLQNGRFDLILLVAPLVTLDRIFEHIPLIGGILEALDTIPLSAKGTLENIQIYPLAPSAIGYDLAEMMKRTVERPINLIHGGQGAEDK